MNQITQKTTVEVPQSVLIDFDGCVITHKSTCIPRMIRTAGEVVSHITGRSRERASEQAAFSFQQSNDAFLVFKDDYGEEKYRSMHHRFDMVARNDQHGVMNPDIPDLMATLSTNIPVFIVSHTTTTALKLMLRRCRFHDDLVYNRAFGMDFFEATQGWLRKDRCDASILTEIAKSEEIDLSKAVLIEDSAKNIRVSLGHGLGKGILTTPNERGGNISGALRYLLENGNQTPARPRPSLVPNCMGEAA